MDKIKKEAKLVLEYKCTSNSEKESHREYKHRLSVSSNDHNVLERLINNVFLSDKKDSHFIVEGLGEDKEPEVKKTVGRKLKYIFTKDDKINFRFKEFDDMQAFYERIRNVEPKFNIKDGLEIMMKVTGGAETILKLETPAAGTILINKIGSHSVYMKHADPTLNTGVEKQ